MRREYFLSFAHGTKLRQRPRTDIFGWATSEFQYLESVVAFTDADCTVAILRLDILFPQIRGLKNMAICINRAGIRKTFQSLCHAILSSCPFNFPIVLLPAHTF